MTREERCKLAIEKGFTYDSETGLIYNRYGKELKKINKGYICFYVTKYDKKYYLLGHQFAWYWVYKECVEEIDHINRIRYDNRIFNLRSVTKQQNSFNRINVKGYSFQKGTNKYRADIRFNNKTIYLGLYHSEQEARNAYLQAKEIYHKF
jgi:hypothetical protein